MTPIPGVDYAWLHPGGAALKAAGKRFACRYLSGDRSKNLSRAEAGDLAAHGVASVVVWESTAKRPLAGHAGGVADAKTAAAQAAACGMPGSRPIYFAVDFDATASQQTAINAYLDGAASVLGGARVGVYGGYYVVKRALDGRHAAWGWQTPAWSGGQWDPRAVIRQGGQVKIGGVSVDLDTALADDYGQWTPGQTPTPVEDDMQLGDDVTLPDWVLTKYPQYTDLADKKVEVNTALGRTYVNARATVDAVTALSAQVGGLSAALGKLAEAGGLDAAEIQAAAQAGAEAALAKLGDALKGV